MCAVTASFQYLLHCCGTRRAGTLQVEIVGDLVHLEENLEEDGLGANADPLTCVRRAGWGMLYADAGIVSEVGGRPSQDDDRHRDRFRRSRPHRVREDGDHAVRLDRFSNDGVMQ